jgi:hypothetical protein
VKRLIIPHYHAIERLDMRADVGVRETPTGRATIETLFLNREGVVNLRQLLYPIGKHPPPLPAE